MHSTPDRTTFDFIRMLGDIIRFQNQGAMILLCQIGSQRRKQDQGISPVDLYLPINIGSVSISDCRCDGNVASCLFMTTQKIKDILNKKKIYVLNEELFQLVEPFKIVDCRMQTV